MPKIDQTVYEGMSRVLRASGQFEQIVSTFCKNSTDRVTQLRDATSKRADVKIAHLAHALKGSCAMFGAKECADLCQQIENCSQSVLSDEKYAQLKNLIDSLDRDLSDVFEFLKKQMPSGNPECCP